MTIPTAEDFLLGSGAKSASFLEVGTIVEGTIVEAPTLQQQKDINTGALKFWDDGNPMMQLVAKVQTADRDADDKDDDGIRAIYIKGNMKTAVADAVRKAGAKGLTVGGTLKVCYTGDGVASKKGFNPPKEYKAQFIAPDPSSSFLGDAPAAPKADTDGPDW